MPGPLHGLLVVSVEEAVAAPLCTAKLADAGARVIKVESPEGDVTRRYDDVVNGESSYFAWLNRGKESIQLDIGISADHALLRNMLLNADVFVQNLPPGIAAQNGLEANDLRRANQRLITVDMSPYGNDGPYRDRHGDDLLVQCESGLVSITGEDGSVGVPVSDIACGMSAHAAVLEALLDRERTGEGKRVRVSQFHAMAESMMVPLLLQELTGNPPPRASLGNPSFAPSGAYATADGLRVAIEVRNETEWQAFCKSVIRRSRIAGYRRFRSNEDRCINRKALDEEIAIRIAALTADEFRDRLVAAGIAYGLVNDMAALSAHPQLRRSTVQGPTGPVTLVAPAAIADRGSSRQGPIPALGEHSDAIRAQFAPAKYGS